MQKKGSLRLGGPPRLSYRTLSRHILYRQSVVSFIALINRMRIILFIGLLSVLALLSSAAKAKKKKGRLPAAEVKERSYYMSGFSQPGLAYQCTQNVTINGAFGSCSVRCCNPLFPNGFFWGETTEELKVKEAPYCTVDKKSGDALLRRSTWIDQTRLVAEEL